MKILVTGGSGFIGTNAVEALSRENKVLNYSLHPPLDSKQKQYWRAGDILDPNATIAAFQEFAPDWVLHLAARADCDENTTVEQGYRANTEGTRNLLEAVRSTPSVQRLIVTSTQFVCAPGRLPVSDTDYFPETVYGQSKVITEQLTRAANLSCCWTIIRPTNVWGPWHMRYRREFWRVLQRGLYVHPGHQTVVRSYGYVRNVVHQIEKIFQADVDVINGHTFYVGDRPVSLSDWVNGFSTALIGKKARVVPRPMLRVLALLGDVPTYFTGKAFLINSSRYRSMTTDYDTPMDRTLRLFGENPWSLQAGIDQTVQWLNEYRGSDVTFGGS